jgi:hypothetical protein
LRSVKRAWGGKHFLVYCLRPLRAGTTDGSAPWVTARRPAPTLVRHTRHSGTDISVRRRAVRVGMLGLHGRVACARERPSVLDPPEHPPILLHPAHCHRPARRQCQNGPASRLRVCRLASLLCTPHGCRAHRRDHKTPRHQRSVPGLVPAHGLNRFSSLSPAAWPCATSGC